MFKVNHKKVHLFRLGFHYRLSNLVKQTGIWFMASKLSRYAIMFNEQVESNTESNTSILYDRFAPGIFGFLIRNTICKQEAEEYLIKVFLEVNKDTQANKDISFIYILKIAAKMISFDKKMPVRLSDRYMNSF